MLQLEIVCWFGKALKSRKSIILSENICHPLAFPAPQTSEFFENSEVSGPSLRYLGEEGRGGGSARAKTSEVLETSEVWKDAHEEMVSVTEEIVRVEKEIDERVKGLYGL